jgi:hypothetical protein
MTTSRLNIAASDTSGTFRLTALIAVVGFLVLGVPFGMVAATIADQKSLNVVRYFLLGEFLGIVGISMARKAKPKTA